MKHWDTWADVIGFLIIVVFLVLLGARVWVVKEAGEARDQEVEVVE